MLSDITGQKWQKLQDRMRQSGVEEKDLVEQFVRSAGHGGQNVNKVATCVMLTHHPTGIQVKCQAGRAQAFNRYQARVILLGKIEQQKKAKHQAAVAAVEKERRRKRKRTKAAKEQMLGNKRVRSLKKKDREKIRIHKMFD
jgi:protein subunit release factor B